ncbi:MAG TPA: RNA methyltransferase [Mycobacterium sp.]|nr:RNA methyltransferase [Mycobacterium sp.]HPZ96422.1 RNA methyltransferase [Mycobacterium sp.]HQE15591.1 RNA methyltransferase [Mycobacterium sp.]
MTAPLTERSSTVSGAAKLHRRAERLDARRFLAEGPNLVEAAARSGVIDRVFATEAAMLRYATLLDDVTANGTAVMVVTDRAMKALSETVTPAGLVAVCRFPEWRLDDVLAAGPSLVAVAVDVADPGNAGTLIRLADAMGAAAVVFAGDTVDPFNGKCVRSSAGSIFAVPVLGVKDTIGLIDDLQSVGLQVLATTLAGEVNLDDADAVLGAPTAWLFGAEAHGLAESVAAAADHRIVIPMSSGVDSLNVAVAAAICLYQSAKAQRRGN